MKCIISLLLAMCVQVVVGVTPSLIVKEATKHVGSTKWSYKNSYGTGKNTNKCNQFVYDVLKAAKTSPPSRRWWKYSPIGAGEWGDSSSTYLTGKTCWKTCTGARKRGDVISDRVHVGIITGITLTTSARSDKVVQNDWGFRPSSRSSGSFSSITACWRYDYNHQSC